MSIELEKYKGKKSRYQCPACNDKSSFVFYIDTDTNTPIHKTVGKCNHESGCGYHYTPKQYFIDNDINNEFKLNQYIKPVEQPRPMGIINFDLVLKSASTESNFMQFLIDLFNDNPKVTQLCQIYALGATKANEVIFWQIDLNSNVRTGKIMQYDPTSGKRKNIDWTHSRMIKAGQLPADYNLKQCFFGEHLLKLNTSGTVAIVESEKTAIIASGLMPEFIWIAAGQLQGLNIDKCKALTGRNVVLFPDLSEKKDNRMSAFEVWSAKASEIMKEYNCKIIVSDLLERNATQSDRQSGFDIADYLIRDLRRKKAPETTQTELKPTPAMDPRTQNDKPFISQYTIKSNWDVEIAELERYFAAVKLPNQPIKLDQCSIITDITLFIDSHICTLKANNGKSIYLPHLNRLQTLKQQLQSNLLKVGASDI